MKTFVRLAFTAVACMCVLTASAAKEKKQAVLQVAAGMKIEVRFYTPGIVRVVKYPAEMQQAPAKKSYSVVLQPEDNPGVEIAEQQGFIVMKSALLAVSLDKTTGQLTYSNAKGDILLREKQTLFEVRKGDADEGKYRVGQTWTLEKDEQIFGLGQRRHPSMSQRGQKMQLWNGNTHIYIPYFTSQKGYGLYWDNAGKSHFEDSDAGTTFLSEVGLCADYYLMYGDGSQDGAIAAIRQLTGQATMFPLWTMGHWQCRERYKTSDELVEVLDKYRELQIPLDGIVQDWQYWGCDSNWNAMKFMNPYYINKVDDAQWAKYLPGDMKKMAAEYVAAGKTPRLKSPEEMVEYVHQKNARLMISIWSSFGPWTEPYAKLKAIGALLPFETWPRNSGVLPYDPFNPKARDIYWQYLTTLYKMGFDAWWTDSTEPDHFEKPGDDDYLTHDGTWRSVKNAFPLLANKGIYEHQRAMKGNKKRSVQMTRSGAFGLQHYATFSWSGDVRASWDEMKGQIPSGLNYTLCGIPFWNTDIGGFFYWDFQQDPKNPALQELQTRWMQWGTFMPLMRNHCSSPMVSEIYAFGKKGDWAYDAMTEAVRLRYRLLPYIYSTAGDVVQNSGSMMRPLVMDFPDDAKAITLNDEYMFGRSILVKPVTDAMYTWKDEKKQGHEIYPDIRQAAAPVKVYLPAGADWYDFWTNAKTSGGKTVMRLCPIDIMPVYVKAGTVMPFGPDVQYSSEKPWDDLEIRVYPGADGSFTLYEDEGDNYNYERGKFTQIVFTWDDASRALTVHPRQGAYDGMLKSRRFRIVVVDSNSGAGNLPMQSSHTVSYSGKRVEVAL